MTEPNQPCENEKPKIHLLLEEALIRQLILDCRNDLVSSQETKNLKLWLTGGWVRDKLLGGESADIDIALSSMTGLQFCIALNDYCSKNAKKYTHEAEKLGITPTVRGFHTVDKNPKKSKHLETCSLLLFGFSVDFVNLRKDDPTSDDQFGTPLEDARRRDATINALFYNLDTQEVEDHTGKGLQDLEARILRTPLDPYETFIDDPLRILRLIRFASRLGFDIDHETQQATKDERIRTTFKTKISRERVGTELSKMINGPDPLKAFNLIYNLNLYSIVFLDAVGNLQQSLTPQLPTPGSGKPWPPTWRRAYSTLSSMLGGSSKLGGHLIRSGDTYYAWIMAAWAPLASLRHTSIESTMKAATEAIKCTSKTSKLLKDALRNMDSIHKFINPDIATPDVLTRAAVGMAIRSWGKTWRLQVLYTILAESIYQQDYEVSFPRLLDRCGDVMEYVSEQGLQDAFSMRQILTAGEIKLIFNLVKSGPFMKNVLDSLMRWQFEHIDASKEDATEWLITQKNVLNIP